MDKPIFYTGIHHPAMAHGLERVMLSLNVLEHRQRDFEAGRWILDSGAFTRTGRGAGHLPVAEYAGHVRRWAGCGDLEAAVCQDYMCEPFVLEATGLTVWQHQELTTRNYLALRDLAPDTHIMPVLQGWDPEDYARHTRAMSPHLEEGAWTGVGSVCQRQGRPAAISAVLTAILRERPDLRLHGFGVKKTALQRADISERLHSADSMAWSYAGRYQDPRQNNSLRYAREWTRAVENCPVRPSQPAML